MKKMRSLFGTLSVLALLAAGGYAFRKPLMVEVLRFRLAPRHDFDLELLPQPPDYRDPATWAALPTMEDVSDQLPAGVQRSRSGVAVFFVHPTTYAGKESWNQPLRHSHSNWVLRERILRHQASVFNGCCDIYAPKYRQATFFSYFDETDNAMQAFEIAYIDVTEAFESFLRLVPKDQGFIIAGHSQGTQHAARLLREKIAPTPLMSRLVAAYLVGFSITVGELGPVPACESAEQTGCAVGWNTLDGDGDGLFGGTDNLLCVNPLSWQLGTGYAGHELNTGAIGYPSYMSAEEGEDVTKMRVEVGAADAQCKDGQLVVADLRSESFPERMPASNSLHVYDYSLFHMNIRDNVEQRVAAFARRGP